MLAYIVIFAASMAGLAGINPIVIIFGALILTAVSAFTNREIYQRADRMGSVGRHMALSTICASGMNGLAACSAAWWLGFVLRMI